MADVKNNNLNKAEQPGSVVDVSSNTQGKRAHGGCAHGGRAHGGRARLEDVQDKGVKAQNEHTPCRENGTIPTSDGQKRSEVSRTSLSYSMGRWLGEGLKEGHWNSHSCGNLG